MREGESFKFTVGAAARPGSAEAISRPPEALQQLTFDLQEAIAGLDSRGAGLLRGRGRRFTSMLVSWAEGFDAWVRQDPSGRSSWVESWLWYLENIIAEAAESGHGFAAHSVAWRRAFEIWTAHASDNDRVARREAHWWFWPCEAGPFDVSLAGFRKGMTDAQIEHFRIEFVCRMLGWDDAESRQLILRSVHVEPQVVAQGVSERRAIQMKSALEPNVRLRIRQGVDRSASTRGRREPIPERVRNEVWRRDEGRCVDCGSRERLEFDHIVPVSHGGSNTARNLELRCEKCNRRKAARI